MSIAESNLTRLLPLKHPVLLAPMGGVSGGNLARTVSEAGGLGLIGASYGDPEWMKAQLPTMKGIDVPWGVGLVMFTVAKRPELLDLALSYDPPVVALSFGDPKPFVDPIRRAGALLFVQVHTVPQAVEALAAGADALIVQGAEAGGHSHHRATFPLIPAVRDAVGQTVPLVAAGGIADGRGLAAALSLGADGGMLGTRFVATPEALPSMKVKNRLLSASASDTVRTRAFDIVRNIMWPEGYAGRAISNKFSERWLGCEEELMSASASVRDAYAEAMRADDVDIKAIWAGEISDIVQDIQPAADLVTAIAMEARSVLRTTLSRLQ